MKKTIVLCVALELTASANAQKKKNKKSAEQKPWPEVKELQLGQTADGRPINGTTIHFTDHISRYQRDTIRHELFLALQEPFELKGLKYKGKMGAFDPYAKKFVWVKDLEGDKFRQSHINDNIVVINPQGVIVYDRANGNKKWMKTQPIGFTDAKHNIGVSKNGTAMDLNTGEVRWKTHIRQAMNVTEVVDLNEDAVLINSGGVKRINLGDGSGWQYKSKTKGSKVDAGGIIGNVLIGTATAMATGVAVMPMSNGEDLDKLNSNILHSGSRIYYASRKDIACLDEKGNEKWVTELEDKKTSSSLIWSRGNAIYMLNFGYGYAASTDEPIRIGDAYVAAFNRKTGEKIYQQNIDPKAFVAGHQVVEDTIWVHSNEKLTKYNLITGEKLATQETVRTKLESFFEFINGDDYYLKTQAGFQPLSVLFPGERFLADGPAVLRIGKNLQPISEIEEEIWMVRRIYRDYYFLESRTQTTIIKNGQPVATLDLTNVNTFENLLFAVFKDELAIIDLKEIFDSL